jgi:hypothetical protein
MGPKGFELFGMNRRGADRNQFPVNAELGRQIGMEENIRRTVLSRHATQVVDELHSTILSVAAKRASIVILSLSKNQEEEALAPGLFFEADRRTVRLIEIA